MKARQSLFYSIFVLANKRFRYSLFYMVTALDKKDHDLIMAAELGACLIDDNENLKKLCLKFTTSDVIEHVLVVPTKAAYSSKKPLEGIRNDDSEVRSIQKCKDELELQVKHLESKIEVLQEALSSKELDIKKLTEFKRVSERQISNANEERDIINSKLSGANDNIKNFEETNLKLLAESTRLHETISILQKKIDSNRGTQEIIEQSNSLKEHNARLISQKSSLEKEKNDLTGIVEESRQALHARNNEIEELKREIERMVERQRSLEWELVSERELISKLQLQITSADINYSNAIPPPAEAETGVLQKSLFSEVDDRRKELENKNNEIMKAHAVYVHRQEMMKDYMKKLLSLAKFKSSDSRIRRLEDALGQAESEKKELTTKLLILEKRLFAAERRDERKLIQISSVEHNTQTLKSASMKLDCDTESYNNGDTSRNFINLDVKNIEKECLIATATVLKEECLELRKEVKTLRLLNASELEKLRNAESILRDREDELVRVKASALQIKLEYDTLKHKINDESQHNVALLQDSRPISNSPNISQPQSKIRSSSTSEFQTKYLDSGDIINGLLQSDDSLHERLDPLIFKTSDAGYETHSAKLLPLNGNGTFSENLTNYQGSDNLPTRKSSTVSEISFLKTTTPEPKRLRVSGIAQARARNTCTHQ